VSTNTYRTAVGSADSAVAAAVLVAPDFNILLSLFVNGPVAMRVKVITVSVDQTAMEH
jgi:hypothetical protein